MRICELKQKEVINIHTCRSLGCPLDVEFCCETAGLKFESPDHAGTGKILLVFFQRK